MPYTDATLVGEVVEVDDAIDLDPFIEVANELVVEICEPAGYTVSRLTKIETWLAAHFYCVRDPRSQSEGAGGVNAAFEGTAQMHLNRTRYGQQALILDTAGGLAALNQSLEEGKKYAFKGFWLGKTASEVEEGD